MRQNMRICRIGHSKGDGKLPVFYSFQKPARSSWNLRCAASMRFIVESAAVMKAPIPGTLTVPLLKPFSCKVPG
ncbi:hypothetical protein PO124_31430 [Bacillus licheniformis]|nr:hypothetical protein [Bacillus licheniformis]